MKDIKTIQNYLDLMKLAPFVDCISHFYSMNHVIMCKTIRRVYSFCFEKIDNLWLHLINVLSSNYFFLI